MIFLMLKFNMFCWIFERTEIFNFLVFADTLGDRVFGIFFVLLGVNFVGAYLNIELSNNY